MKIIYFKIKQIIIFSLIFLIFLIILFNPNLAKNGAKSGILINYEIILPSLFPFLTAVTMLNNCNIQSLIPFFNKKPYLKNYLYILIFSHLGGYPIGAKILSSQVNKGLISKGDANLMLLCSINPGPAFTILVVGKGILNSINAGIILYVCQILSSIIIFCCIYRFLEKSNITFKKARLSLSEIFVNSVSDSSYSMLNISGYIILCSVILEIANSKNFGSILNFLFNSFLEVSNGIIYNKNIFFLSAVLSFASFSIIFQVLYISREFKPNLFKIIISKVINIILNIVFLKIFLKLFPINIETITNIGENFLFKSNHQLILTVFLIITFITFLASITNKQYCGKISEDIF